MTFNPSLPHPNPISITEVVDRGDWCSLSQQLSDSSKHDKADMAKALSTAADKGLQECARVLLEAGTLPNIHDASGFTPLIIAAKRGHIEIVKLLLQKPTRCRVNKATFHIRATALHWAVTNGHEQCVRVLLEEGADPSLTTIHGRTPLMLAARNDEDDILRLLLAKGSEVEAGDFGGATALHLAAEEGADTCARELLHAGADINAQMKNGNTPIMSAARKAQPVVLRMLLHKASLNLEKRCHHLGPLHWAAIGGSSECVDALLYRGLSPDIKTLDSHFGISGCLKWPRMKEGTLASPYFPSKFSGGDLIVNSGVTPLMLAAERGHMEVIRTLVSHGAVVDECDDEGKTSLLYAIRKQHLDCVKLLLEQRADPDGIVMHIADDNNNDNDEDIDMAHEERGVSPIFYAIKQNNVDTVKLLLQSLCNLRILGYLKESVYVTPLEFSISKQRSRIARMLLAAGCGTDMASQDLVQMGLAVLLQGDEQEFARLAELFCTPASLLQLARNSVRQSLGKGLVRTSIDALPLPALLQGYVNLSDLDDL